MLRTVAKGGTALVAILFASLYLGPRRGEGPIANPPPLPYLSGAVVLAEGVDPVGLDASSSRVAAALRAFRPQVGRLSDSRALDAAFRSYFAYQSRHPQAVRKPYLYFVDFGLPSTRPRGYVFDMRALRVVEGPFTVSHGRGSSTGPLPTRFSNVPGSKATSLGLYLAQETYTFGGRAGGRPYTSVGLRMQGLSRGFNDNARARRVVVHGAPYVTAARAGLSEGCPAMEQARARRLLPRLAHGGMVFHFAPDERWLASDPWLARGLLASAD